MRRRFAAAVAAAVLAAAGVIAAVQLSGDDAEVSRAGDPVVVTRLTGKWVLKLDRTCSSSTARGTVYKDCETERPLANP